MKGLRKYIAPFAPDQSGACAVLCQLGGMVIILDAGGCAGNICGFDEPRWFGSRSAIFSAGLRDMDAILGRDERLVEKIEKACRRLQAAFIAVVGTPVPSVIGTDYRALKRMIEKKTGLPVITVDTNGMELYDAGVRKALKAVFTAFVKKTPEPASLPGSLGILGATPLDLTVEKGSWDVKRAEDASQGRCAGLLIDYYKNRGYQQAYPFGLTAGIRDIKMAGQIELNMVLSPAAIPTARYLKDNFGVPFQIEYPLETLPGWEDIKARLSGLAGKRILIAHQQVLANSLRDYISGLSGETSDISWRDEKKNITVISWFEMDKELSREQDMQIREEDQWIALIQEGNYDCIIGDALFHRAVPDYAGLWIDIDHFAVSGRR